VSALLRRAAIAVAASACAAPACRREPTDTPAAVAAPAAAAVAPPSAPPPQEPPPQQLPRAKIPPYSFELEPKDVDLGTLRPDQEGRCEFTIVNTDARPLRILNVDGSCDCTSFTYEPTEIPPGGRRVVKVVVHAENRGSKRLSALVQAFDSAATKRELEIHYVVLAALSFAPAEVSFGRRVVGSDGAADVVVRFQQAAGSPPLALAPKLNQELPLRWKFGVPKTTTTAGVCDVALPLHLELDAQKTVPAFRAVLEFDAPSHLPARLVVSGEVHPGWYLDPNQLQWVTKVGAKSRATVRLCWTTPEGPKILALEPSDPALAATSTLDAGGRAAKIEVVFEPKQAGEFTGELRVKIDRTPDPLVVRCKATVR
jgi:hypothetical protein